MTRLVAIVAVVASCATAALSASASSPVISKDLWATVNVCDTTSHDNMMGVRASMPGDGSTRTKMFMRFSAQYYDRSAQLWSDVKGSGTSKWISVGSGIHARRESGYTFAFDPPKSGRSFILRGAVDFRWMNGRTVTRHAQVLTKRGHPYTTGADPQSYTASTCQIR